MKNMNFVTGTFLLDSAIEVKINVGATKDDESHDVQKKERNKKGCHLTNLNDF